MATPGGGGIAGLECSFFFVFFCDGVVIKFIYLLVIDYTYLFKWRLLGMGPRASCLRGPRSVPELPPPPGMLS